MGSIGIHVISQVRDCQSIWLYRPQQQQQSEEKFQVYEIRLDNPPVWPEGMNATQAQLAVPEWGILEFIGEFASNEDDGARSKITDQARPHYTTNNSDTSYSRPIMELSSW
jgi:hypothetical protein